MTASTIASPRPVLPAARDLDCRPARTARTGSGCSSGGMPGPSSATLEPGRAAGRIGGDRDGHRGPGGGVLGRVAEQVREYLAQPVLVAAYLHRLVRAAPAATGGPGAAARASLVASIASRVRSTGCARSGRPASSRASSSRSSTSPLILADSDVDPLQRVRTSGGSVTGLAPGQLGVAPDRGQRGAQLVAGVGREAAQPGLAGVPPGQRGLDVAEHPVERLAELADLGARIGVPDPVRQRHLAAGQRQLGDLGRGRGHPASGRSESRTQPVPTSAGEQQREPRTPRSR